MLILTRKQDQVIRIGDDIKVVILGVDHNQVRVGVEAPRDLEVHRQEVYEKIQQERRGRLKPPPTRSPGPQGGRALALANVATEARNVAA